MSIDDMVKLLDKEHINKLQDGITELLLDRLEKDIDEWAENSWSFDTRYLEDVTREAIESAVKKVKKDVEEEYSQILRKSIRESIDKHFSNKGD